MHGFPIIRPAGLASTLVVAIVLCVLAGICPAGQGYQKGHYSSARDLATMARVAMQNPGAGTRLGRVIVRVDGEEVGKTPLVSRRGYQKPSLGQRLWYTVGGIFQ